jgi:hypothetical protein
LYSDGMDTVPVVGAAYRSRLIDPVIRDTLTIIGAVLIEGGLFIGCFVASGVRTAAGEAEEEVGLGARRSARQRSPDVGPDDAQQKQAMNKPQGVRACGKTMTGLNAASSYVFIDTDDAQQMRAVAPQSLLEGDAPRLVDEWQFAPELWNMIRRRVDASPNNGRFILRVIHRMFRRERCSGGGWQGGGGSRAGRPPTDDNAARHRAGRRAAETGYE